MIKKLWIRFWCSRNGHDIIEYSASGTRCMKCDAEVDMKTLDRKWDKVKRQIDKHNKA